MLMIFRVVALCIIFIGTGVSFDTAWNMTDILMGLVAIVNILAVFALSKVALNALKNYDKLRKTGEKPIFKAKDINLNNTECWK